MGDMIPARKRRLATAGALTVTLALLAGACSPAATSAPSSGPVGQTTGPSTPAPTVAADVVARVAAPLEPSTLDLTSNTENAITAMLLYNVLETLTELHPDGTITPLLATTWDLSDDGLKYTFNLVEATFHDGTPLTAEDVVWTFLKRRDNATDPQAADFEKVVSVVAVDPKTVEVTLSAPSNSFLKNISKRSGVILSERSYGSIATAPVGTGPFKFKDWKRGQSLSLERSDGYWGKAPSLAGVEFRFITDKNAELNAFLAGEVDILALVSVPARLEEIRSRPEFKVDLGASGVVQLLAMNTAIAPFDDLSVRQAIAHAIDRDAINEGAENGNATVTAVFATQLDPFFDDYNPYPHDTAKAIQLLTDAGYDSGELELTLMVVADDPNAIIGQILQSQLAAVGITVTLQPVDIGTYVDQAITAYNYQLATIGHVAERITRFICDPGTPGSGGWYVQYCDGQVSDALQLADTVTDPAESVRQYQVATHRLADQVGALSLYSWPWISATSANVSGYPASPINELMDLRNVVIQP